MWGEGWLRIWPYSKILVVQPFPIRARCGEGDPSKFDHKKSGKTFSFAKSSIALGKFVRLVLFHSCRCSLLLQPFPIRAGPVWGEGSLKLWPFSKILVVQPSPLSVGAHSNYDIPWRGFKLEEFDNFKVFFVVVCFLRSIRQELKMLSSATLQCVGSHLSQSFCHLNECCYWLWSYLIIPSKVDIEWLYEW